MYLTGSFSNTSYVYESRLSYNGCNGISNTCSNLNNDSDMTRKSVHWKHVSSNSNAICQHRNYFKKQLKNYPAIGSLRPSFSLYKNRKKATWFGRFVCSSSGAFNASLQFVLSKNFSTIIL